MSFLRNASFSIVAAALSVVVGWFTGYAVGWLIDHHYSAGPGTGLATVWLMYAFALAFGAIGFVVCMVWLNKRQHRRQTEHA
jgi:Na+-driven multidrug efflux pump